MNEIHININPNNCYFDVQFGLCGKLFGMGAAVADLEYWWQGLEVLRGICPDCLAAGPVGAGDRTRNHAKDLKEWADSLEALACEIEITPKSNWKTSAELRAEEDRLENLMRQVEDEQNRKIGEMIADSNQMIIDLENANSADNSEGIPLNL
jgi:hypothetical protein